MICATFTAQQGMCVTPAYYILIYGCLDGHIAEVPRCDQHANELIKAIERKGLACATCNKFVEEMFLMLATEASKNFKDHWTAKT
jgi:hypothetical protein